ncbi:MAG: CAP domain-containing protein [Pyrinomonadaceae bacterium]
MKVLKFTSTAVQILATYKSFLFLIIISFFVLHIGASFADAQKTVKRPPKCSGVNGLSQAEITEIVNVHNFVRNGLNLESLTWDCRLADFAQEWAKRGVAEHRDDREYGESIFVSGARDVAAISAVNKWMMEKFSWDNKTGKCKPGKVCTHYTQIVWKRTKRIGCGINRNAPGKWKTMLVCNYDPAGNDPGPAY